MQLNEEERRKANEPLCGLLGLGDKKERGAPLRTVPWRLIPAGIQGHRQVLRVVRLYGQPDLGPRDARGSVRTIL